jgi:hypothetical protein
VCRRLRNGLQTDSITMEIQPWGLAKDRGRTSSGAAQAGYCFPKRLFTIVTSVAIRLHFATIPQVLRYKSASNEAPYLARKQLNDSSNYWTQIDCAARAPILIVLLNEGLDRQAIERSFLSYSLLKNEGGLGDRPPLGPVQTYPHVLSRYS